MTQRWALERADKQVEDLVCALSRKLVVADSLLFFRRRPGSSCSELAQFLVLSRRQANDYVVKLVECGVVERRERGRQRPVFLTELGQAVAELLERRMSAELR